MRGQRAIITRPDTAAAALVQRQFSADRPNPLWVSDFTYVATWRGFVYVAFVIDVFSRRILGGRTSRCGPRSYSMRWNKRYTTVSSMAD